MIKGGAMYTMIGRYVPLIPVEGPGDPELGGWRPLRFYTQPGVSPLSVEEAVRVVAARLAEFQLRQAIGIVAHRLAS